MRWNIKENKHSIESTNFINHKDDIEMSGEKVSMIISYEVDKDGFLKIGRKLIYPMYRTIPNDTYSSYMFDYNHNLILNIRERFVKVVIDGTLTIYSETDEYNIIHRFYPSTEYPIAYEQIQVTKKKHCIDPMYINTGRINTLVGYEGVIHTDLNMAKEGDFLTFSFTTHFSNESASKEKDSYIKRMARVNELINECDLDTGYSVLDTVFAFAKVRVGESIYNTRNGKINSPGGGNYYAGVWTNDQCEYSTPWFAYTNDGNELEAAFNAMDWFEKYMNDKGEPLVSSIISEGMSYWNSSGDRGDASMYLYGNTMLYLIRGETPDQRHHKMLEWAANYIESKILDEGVVYSDTDELEGRLSLGINLSTSSLSYGAFMEYATLNERMGLTSKASKYRELAYKISQGIESYFGGNIKGYETYHYHKECSEIRAWNCLPLYMGIRNRSQDTIISIDKLLWVNESLKSTESENIVWDRSALYYIAALFRCGESDNAWDRLIELSTNRLLGDRVPYAIEAWPEYNMRHLSAESALFARIITDGLLNITFNKDGFAINPSLPKSIKNMSIKNIYICGNYYDIFIKNGNVKLFHK